MVFLGILLLVIDLDFTRLSIEAQQTITHGTHPDVALAVGFQIEDTGRGALWQGVRMKSHAFYVDISQTLFIGAQPDTSLQVFAETQYGSREIILEMFHHLVLTVQTVESVAVGTYPTITVGTAHHTGNASRSNDVTRAELIAHIAKAHGMARLHVDTLLQQSEPHVAITVLTNGIDLRRAQVDITAEIGIVDQVVVLRVVDGQSRTVVTQHDVLASVDIQRGNMFVACGLDMDGRIAVKTI